ncbi:HAMP domain-containing sensor histidine kinase [Thalassotalea fonticola]|uniref:histidine kinase n=1 Tax=Thalassotalea fonticola TaxID=3065649 RepID=A0ABZ0GL29_9GAMM|nr:HAMP domain-containing sensor histidine kinase [Colwelliaceae bacterium S1-1]
MIFSDKRLLNYSQRLRRLRYLAIGLLLFLSIPIGTLLYFGFQQIEDNLLTEYQREASNLALKINRTLYKKLTFTNTLSVHDFDYYQQVYNPVTKQQQQVLSPLSSLSHLQLNNEQPIKGLVGYFQYDSQGRFNSPIWPEPLSEQDLSDKRLTIDDANKGNQQASYPKLNPESVVRKKAMFKIYQILSQSKALSQMIEGGDDKNNHYFSIIFDIPDYFIFYRIVSVAEHSRLQGYLVKRQPYLREHINDTLAWRSFKSPVLVKLQDVEYSAQTELFFYENLPDGQATVSHPLQPDSDFEQQAIYHTKLQWPYEGYSLSLSTYSLPLTSAMVYSGIFIIILIAAILSACFGFYRLGVKQLALAEQRLNFVSSVSHELKTPLTSIRMYSQMLKEGMVISETHQQDYYAFIYDESERLTRLINNILQLSTLSHRQQKIQPEHTRLTILQDVIRSKTSSIIDNSNFQQNIVMEIADAENMLVFVDLDAFSQVVINITDNAVKFFDQQQINDLSRQKIDFIFRQHPKHKHLIQLEIRDYGEGITLEQESKIFELFYRGGDELTRTTQGTGIGLALVNELVLAQQGEIKLERKEPGLAMLLSFHAKY